MDGRRADLVLEGGGVKGCALLGAVIELRDHGMSFQRVAGTSAGAIVGALVAAYGRAGRDVNDLVDVLGTIDYTRFAKATGLARLGLVGKGFELLLHDGVYSGDYLVEWLGAELDRVGIRTFGDLRADDDPGTSLQPHERYQLVVVTSDISRGQLVRLPWDYHHYGLDPDTQSIVEAVRASMSYPFFFRPVTLKCGTDMGGEVTLVDGGMLSNFPVEIFDRSDGQPSRWPTIGLKLSARSDARMVSRDTSGPISMAMACLHTLLDAHDAYHLNDIHSTDRTVFIDTDKVSTLDFEIDEETTRTLFENGRAAARAFLNRTIPVVGADAPPTPAVSLEPVVTDPPDPPN